MQYIHHRGGFVYGGLWSTVRWAQGKGVDTSDFQRIAEYAIDHLAVQDPLHLTSFALGSEPARVQIKSLREAQRLITGIWSGEKGGAPAEEQKANKYLVLDRLAHPEFSILTTSHRGTTLEETLASFSLFWGLPGSPARAGPGWELTLTPVAVALGIGMASRLGRLVSDGQKAFDPERVAVLLGWLNGLESERRLARHLLLSGRPGWLRLPEGALLRGCCPRPPAQRRPAHPRTHCFFPRGVRTDHPRCPSITGLPAGRPGASGPGADKHGNRG